MGWLSDLSHKFQDWRDDMKGTFVFDAAKSVGRVGADVIQYGSVPFGALFGGPLGAALATPVAAAAGQVGPNKDRGDQLKRDLISGFGVSLGSAAFNLISGASLNAPLYSSLFGWGPKPPGPATAAKPMSDTELYAHFLKVDQVPKAAASAASSGGLLDLAGKLIGGTQANPANLQKQYQDQVELAKKLQAAGDMTGAAQAAALAEVYRRQLAAQGSAAPSGAIPLGLIAVGALVAWLVFRKK